MRNSAGFKQRRSSSENAFGPGAAIGRLEPQHGCFQVFERRGTEQLREQFVDALLERAILGPETIRLNSTLDRRYANQQRVRIHPPRKPCFQLRLAAEFVYQVTVIVQDGAVGNHMRGAARGFEFGSDLRVQNPELALERGCGIYGKWRLARNFRDEFDVVPGFLEQRADFVGECRLANAVSADEREFHFSRLCATAGFLLAHFCSSENTAEACPAEAGLRSWVPAHKIANDFAELRRESDSMPRFRTRG